MVFGDGGLGKVISVRLHHLLWVNATGLIRRTTVSPVFAMLCPVLSMALCSPSTKAGPHHLHAQTLQDKGSESLIEHEK